ncbi:MAG: glycerophosphoryl diester phosphodiesterase [Mycobacterium sp.]|jgi:glycerophosphoryl diester phosphodiesterase|nr:glycerophosphoryl diester phosphodiesterase [Mycobacterium sp.]
MEFTSVYLPVSTGQAKLTAMDVWGHRGSREPGPENTPRAVAAAIAAGAGGCEVDARRTADGVLVCHHDPLVGSRAIIQSSAADLIAAGVPLLSDVIAAAGKSRLVLEVKNVPGEPDFTAEPVAAQLLVALLAELADLPDVLISSFDPGSLDAARAAGWPVGLLTIPGISVDDGLAYATQAGYQELHAHVIAIEAAGTAPGSAVHDAGLRLVAWTVTSVAQALAMQSRGVDAVICDDPAAIVGALAKPG